ncbi:hypothetical protein QQS21_001226 [Conoideocrella luteorostrata]|uniref:Uncharacterized protein n=1 Tax=Conoideocrella luteorostrata TaxID=1105319 RepID=A0AAJ0CXG8_9HYPO|nr:hypothetical protein QQS21_001226 [Conoideocrella luteorostrata]
MSFERKKTKQQLHRSGRNQISVLNSPFAAKQYPTATAPEHEPQVPSPAIFDFPSNANEPQATAHKLPVAAACATHLELLEVFYVTRQKVLMSAAIDSAFDIVPNRETKTGHKGDKKTLKDATLWDRRQIKWTTYVEIAAVRFMHWMRMLERRVNQCTKLMTPAVLTLRDLPPLDVLMVWHSFMLNPRLYMEKCQGHVLYKIRMPWNLVHQAIDNRSWTFDIGADATCAFEALSGLPADLFQQFESWMARDVSSAEDGIVRLTELTLGTERTALVPALFPNSPINTSRLDYKYAGFIDQADNHLAIQLRDAVVRQSAFVDKMNARMWIRSPALEGTLRRGINRYDKFLALLRMYPRQTIVPTLDIDLVWHTHQCAPAAYVKGTKAIVGRFINHDDTIVKERLSGGFDVSRTYFRVHFGTEYRVCGCWDCEALLSEVEAAAKDGSEPIDMAAVAGRVMQKVHYHRAVEVAIRNKKPLPLWEEAVLS